VANTKSAKKQILVNERNAVRNKHFKTILKGSLKNARTAIDGGEDASAAAALVNSAVQTIYKSASKGVIDKHSASRRVSRIMLAYQKKFGLTPGAGKK
jgi:small subunit ribosomal protein S20